METTEATSPFVKVQLLDTAVIEEEIVLVDDAVFKVASLLKTIKQGQKIVVMPE